MPRPHAGKSGQRPQWLAREFINTSCTYTTQTPPSMGRSVTRLEILNLSWCVAVDDEAPIALGAHCPNLTWLSLHGNRNVTDAGIDALSTGCLKLTSLDVSGCSQVTDYLRREGVLVGKFPHVVKWRLHT